MNDIIAKMYGGAGNSRAQSTQPDFTAADRGDAIGGSQADRGPMGSDINWSSATTSQQAEGDIVNTPAGQYQVVRGESGYQLAPLEGAIQTYGGRSFDNLTHGIHHIGIDPQTGETYYQSAPDTGRYFSDTNESYQARLDQIAAQQDNGEPPNPVVVEQPNPVVEQPNPVVEPSDPISSRPYAGGALSGNPYATTPLQELGFLRKTEKPQYMKMLNEALMGSLFKDLL